MARKQKIFSEIKSYLIITLGLAIYCFAWTGLLAPAEVMGGGVSGIGLLIYHATGGVEGGVPIGTSFLVVNAILLIAGVFTIGPKFGAKTIFAIIMATILLRLGQAYLPADIFQISNDKFLTSILGGALCGIGMSLCFSRGGSTGGTDIIAMILNKYFRLSLGRVIVFCDIIIVGSAYFIFNNVAAIVYGYITMGVLGYTLDMILSGNKQTVQLMIMTKKYKEMTKAITTSMPRGVTLLKSMGGYTEIEGYVVMVYCRRNEVNMISNLVRDVDSTAFVTTTSVSGVYGKGFEELRRKKINSIK